MSRSPRSVEFRVEKLATMVSAGDTPDVVEMPDRWLSLYAKNGNLESLDPIWRHGKRRGLERSRPDGALRRQHRLLDYVRPVFAGSVLQQSLVQEDRHYRGTQDHG